MNILSADEILGYIIELLLSYLEELNKVHRPDKEQFISGERTAYVECLEIIQSWEHARKNGLDFDIEARFPV